MKYREIIPGERLRPYVKCYYIFESETDVALEDTVFPGGYMEIIFNLGSGVWKSAVNNTFCNTPPVELWGQITRPLAVRATGKNTMLGIKFLPHAAACFLNEDIWEFNDQINDLRDLLGAPVRTLHSRLIETVDPNKRIALIENFLLSRLPLTERKSERISMVGEITNDIKQNNFPGTIESIASRYGITPRYLQKLFLQFTGVTPKMYGKINRFQRSLKLMHQKDATLTSIAYDCGYFDQSHFIREFRSFTGLTPSDYSPEHYPVGQVFANN